MGTITRNFANNILGTGEVDATDGVNGTIPATNVADASLNNVTSLPSSVGYAIKSVASDPPSLNAGEIFYNSTSGAFKALVNVEAWSSGAPLSIARRGPESTGTVSTALAFGGGLSTPELISTEEYTGSGWSTGGSLNTGRVFLGGAGTQTAGLAFGGTTPQNLEYTQTELYNGTSWSEQNDLSQARQALGGTGTETAALAIAGSEYVPTTINYDVTEEYDGTSWTSGGSLSSARRSMAASGTQTAAISAGGNEPTLTLVEEYNGTSWSEVADITTARVALAGSGIQTSTLIYGGSTDGSSSGNTTATEAYDGTSWSNKPSLATARRIAGGAGANSSEAVYAGGYSTVDISLTEEYNSSTNTITAAAWASATAMPRNHGEHIGGSGSASDGLAFGGEGPTNYNYTEEWNGSSWTAGGNWPASDESIMGCGTSGPTTIGFGGIGNIPGTPPVNRQSTSATYDGSSWTTTNSLPVAKRAGQGFGTNTAAVAAGGDTSPTDPQTSVEEWDGTNWTAVTALPEGKGNMGGGTGTQTAGLVFGGYNPSPAGTSNTTFEYDGTSWTAGGNMNVGRNQVNGWGGPAGQTASICGGGNANAAVSLLTEAYDGTSWSTKPNLATARQGSANGIGTSQTTGIQAGGSTGSYVTTVEEFTGETVTQVAKTLSSS